MICMRVVTDRLNLWASAVVSRFHGSAKFMYERESSFQKEPYEKEIVLALYVHHNCIEIKLTELCINFSDKYFNTNRIKTEMKEISMVV